MSHRIVLFTVVVVALLGLYFVYPGISDFSLTGAVVGGASNDVSNPVIHAGENKVRVLIKTFKDADIPGLKKAFGARREFDGGKKFTAEVPVTAIPSLRSFADVTEVETLSILKRPVCGDGICQGNEPRTCASDCTASPPPSSTDLRYCLPSSQLPWNIVMVNGGTGGSGVKIALLDSGVNRNHPDLSRRVIDCKDFTGIGIINGCEDKNGHGTHVAGIIAADGGIDGKGITGVAPQASILALKVCSDDGRCYADDIAAAIDYARSAGANIASISLGSNNESSLIKEAISRNPSLLFIAAGGNDGPELGSIDWPAADSRVMGISALDELRIVPSWSSRGVNNNNYIIETKDIEAAAPGVGILSTWIDGCYRVLSGTSMAAPHVSGLAAKLWQGSAEATRAFLQERAKLVDIDVKGDDSASGFGMAVGP